jgi:PAS domain S-box-containing protein
MSWQYNSHLAPLLVTAALALFCASSIWPLRRAPGARVLLALLMSAAGWALTDFVQYGFQELAPKLIWENGVYLWAGLTPVLWLVFCLEYTYTRGRLRASEFASLLVIPAIGLIIAYVNPTDGLMRRSVSLQVADGVVRIAKTYGPYFWVMAFYLQALMLAGTVLLVRHISRSGRTFGGQGVMLLLAALCPWIANGVYLVTGFSFFQIDPTPLGMGISGALLVIALRKMALFDLSPAGRDAAIEAMRDGWMVIDQSDRIVDLNPAARSMLVRGGLASARVADLTGRRMSILAPSLSPMLRAHMEPPVHEEPVSLGRSSDQRQYRVAQSEIVDRYGEVAGTVLTLHDVTRQIANQREREELIEALQQALADVSQLSGLLPICAECKKIRSDEGYWTQLEAYLERHSNATFTHSLCPDCLRRLEEHHFDRELFNGDYAVGDETGRANGHAAPAGSYEGESLEPDAGDTPDAS